MKKAVAAVVRVFRPMTDYFELLHLPESYRVDLAMLEKHYRDVQAAIHPDRFVNKSDVEKRTAVQYSALLNDAYQTLLSPVKRAVYLLRIKGVELDLEHETLKDEVFLMQQMDFRERLDDGEDLTAEMSRHVESLEMKLLDSFASGNYAEAKVLTQQLQFFDRLLNH